MANDDKKLEKITITRAVVFDKQPRMVGDIVDVSDDSLASAAVLIRSGKAVAGAVKMAAAAANKQIGSADMDKK